MAEESVCATSVRTGRELARSMKYRQAMTCYRTALNLVKDQYSSPAAQHVPRDQLERDVFYYCEAISCAVETCLHLNNTEAARDILVDYQYPIVFDSLPPDISHSDKVNWTFGHLYLHLGKHFIDQQWVTTAKEYLEKSKDHLYQLHSEEAQHSYAELLGLYGVCNLLSRDYSAAEDQLLDAIELWRKRKYPLYHIRSCISAMKHYIECKLRLQSPNTDDHNVCTDMLRLHKALCNRGLNNEVPEAFTELGFVAFREEKEKTSLAFFEESLALYKQMPASESIREEIIKLLKDIGVASYNCRDFHKAAQAYKECLDLLKQSSSGSTTTSNMAAVAECCAALGFTYSRLRDFDRVLEYYERALELHHTLSIEDLELIETNIGTLYYVKAVLSEEKGEEANARKFYATAESSFTKALRYSWKSFPFINYGYYLLCRQQYLQATPVLQQGYLNGRVDRDTVEFDHTEDPILLPDLRRELEGCADIRMPSTIIALYLKTLCLHRMGHPTAARTAMELKNEAEICVFEQYYTECFGLERMKALSLSLAGYAFRMVGEKSWARTCFQRALAVMPEYPTAADNIKSLASL